MANRMVNKTEGSPIGWTAGEAVYAALPGAGKLALLDQLGARLCQLDAMLSHATVNHEAIADMSDEHRSGYLWAMSMAASECRELVERLSAEVV